MSHYEQRLESDLAKIRDSVHRLSQQVAKALHNAQTALLTGDESAAYGTVLGDYAINRDSRDIDRMCHAFIARHLPSAGHLRLMASIIRVNVALERIGDYAVTICRESVQLSSPPSGKIATQLESLAEEARQLLSGSIDAFNQGDSQRARELMKMPERIESIMDDIYDRVMEKKANQSARDKVADFVIFSLLKRVADQAKNICDQTVFSVEGEEKAQKTVQILFIDEDNSTATLMAEAIATKRYPHVAGFASAGRVPVEVVDPALLRFMEDRGLSTTGAVPRSLDSMQLSLSAFDVVVGLDKPVKEYFSRLPFHTSALTWSLPELSPGSSDEEKASYFEEVYRALVSEIDSLMSIFVGENDS